LALEFHRQSYRVLATARSQYKIAHLAALGIETLELSVDDSASVNALLEEVRHLTNGHLDILINNAGQNYTMPALDVDVEEVKALFDANVFGIMRMCKAFAPLVIEAQGSIVMIGSLGAVMPYVFGSCYGATKAAVRGYADCLRLVRKSTLFVDTDVATDDSMLGTLPFQCGCDDSHGWRGQVRALSRRPQLTFQLSLPTRQRRLHQTSHIQPSQQHSRSRLCKESGAAGHRKKEGDLGRESQLADILRVQLPAVWHAGHGS
jgi:hypothetical protein